MTAETLKPFITTTSAEHFLAGDHQHGQNGKSNRQKTNSMLLPIALAVVAIVLGISLLGSTVWMTLRLNKMELEVHRLNDELTSLQKLVEHMQNRLGLHYLDDLNEFKKEYDNALLEHPNAFDEDKDIDIDSKETPKIEGKYIDEEYDDYNDRLDVLAKQYEDLDEDKDDDEDEDVNDNDNDNDHDDDNADGKAVQAKIDENVSDDDNFYDDFGKYKDSKKRVRKIRSILALEGEVEDEKKDSTKEDKKVHHRHRTMLGRRKHHFMPEDNKYPSYPIYNFLHKKKYRTRKSRVNKSDDSHSGHLQLNGKNPHRHSSLKIDFS